MNKTETIAIVGLGYVGLPVALAFASKYERVIGFDINRSRIDELKSGHDRTSETDAAALKASRLHLTCDPADLREATFYVVTVPTPIDSNRQPDLTPVVRASETVGKALKAGKGVVFDALEVKKVVSGEDEESSDRVAAVYGSIITAGVHRA